MTSESYNKLIKISQEFMDVDDDTIVHRNLDAPGFYQKIIYGHSILVRELEEIDILLKQAEGEAYVRHKENRNVAYTKPEIENYLLASDPQIIELRKKKAVLKEQNIYLEDTLNNLKSFSFVVTNSLGFRKFFAGE